MRGENSRAGRILGCFESDVELMAHADSQSPTTPKAKSSAANLVMREPQGEGFILASPARIGRPSLEMEIRSQAPHRGCWKSVEIPEPISRDVPRLE